VAKYLSDRKHDTSSIDTLPHFSVVYGGYCKRSSLLGSPLSYQAERHSKTVRYTTSPEYSSLSRALYLTPLSPRPLSLFGCLYSPVCTEILDTTFAVHAPLTYAARRARPKCIDTTGILLGCFTGVINLLPGQVCTKRGKLIPFCLLHVSTVRWPLASRPPSSTSPAYTLQRPSCSSSSPSAEPSHRRPFADITLGTSGWIGHKYWEWRRWLSCAESKWYGGTSNFTKAFAQVF
jgi:hypothetical protein